jgi:A/G-specific adenine glycosylase
MSCGHRHYAHRATMRPMDGSSAEATADPTTGTVERILTWYATAARDLPWRRPAATAWGILVSEIMLQQTPVSRVQPAWEEWITRWPTPSRLAADPPAEAVRAWGRLGYPRRALRLHAAAVAMVERHDGEVPSQLPDLLALPGVGTYTARAVAAFAFGQRVPVVDTNVARVTARLMDGSEPGATVRASDLVRVEALLPQGDAPRASVALMELGALVCTARDPRCENCPVRSNCRWSAAGRPAGGVRRVQAYAGTDRQVRGRLLAIMRDASTTVTADVLATAWDEPVQRGRALDSLLADGLIERRPGNRFALPGDRSG